MADIELRDSGLVLVTPITSDDLTKQLSSLQDARKRVQQIIDNSALRAADLDAQIQNLQDLLAKAGVLKP